MANLIVVDIGNSRMKWGLCNERQVREAAPLPLDDAVAWQEQMSKWPLSSPTRWVVAGVNPGVVAQFSAWADTLGQPVELIDSYRKLPVQIAVEYPECVGLDRLLNAVAAASRGPGAAILVDAGSAVTVDWLDGQHAFQGGAIFPGLRLMAQALKNYTAKLPLVEVGPELPPMPGTATEAAIKAGIHGAVLGGIKYLVNRLLAIPARRDGGPVRIYLTGGDAQLLASELRNAEVWPFMTLEGIRLAAARLP